MSYLDFHPVGKAAAVSPDDDDSTTTAMDSTELELDRTVIVNSQHGFRFLSLPQELKDFVYEHHILAPITITKLYPARATDKPVPASALAYASHETGRESMPTIYKNVHLLLHPQPGFALATIPRNLLRDMPKYARFVDKLTIDLVFRAPFHRSPIGVEVHAMPRDVLVKFQMNSKKIFKISASAEDPVSEWGRDKVLGFMKKTAEEVKVFMVTYLKENAVLEKELVETERGPSFRWTKWEPC